MKFVRVPVIHYEKDRQWASRRLRTFLSPTSPVPRKDPDEIKVLALVVEDFERARFPIRRFPDPIAAIKFRMDQMGLTALDLIPIIGSQSAVSKLLRGKQLSLNMIRSLHKKLCIPAETLIQPLPKRRKGVVK
mgnify:FL=1